ncbi:YdeI/OmpD-associated family protein [Marnyiella aurantia]|uniref:YdeI/OmpD-associated family protein n=1 Tax=Marnyiella aurantia TaxID=2758037 RepID=A0A7D7LUF0_9FLAO|nr:YdeI/OmpD-associated family protein [Marnyiella aurantia]MBA5245659.1 YdeI/OmpD-associated family protein [Marnyiella aurantia]QMS98933.1 YdeI/OmpD-associated family protein [Marnyiella aurantia]
MEVKFFASSTQFRAWLAKNHDKEKELLVGFYKVRSGKPSMSWSESVDQALCFGWIDGIRKSVDTESYTIRFTPRRPDSIWSAVNVRKVAELSAAGLMEPAGLKAFSKKNDSRSGIYSHEKPAEEFPTEMETIFADNPVAWEFFCKQPPSYRKVIIHWIMTAKRETTRTDRLKKVIEASLKQERLQ